MVDLARAHALGLSADATGDFLGGSPETVPERYAATSPAALLPLGVPQLLVHGTADDSVPFELSEGYVEAARAAGDEATLLALPGTGHFEVIDPLRASGRRFWRRSRGSSRSSKASVPAHERWNGVGSAARPNPLTPSL